MTTNKCAAPDASVDALGAGDSGVSQLKGYFTMIAPMIIWMYVVPWITGQIFPTQFEWIEKPGQASSPSASDGSIDDPLADDTP